MLAKNQCFEMTCDAFGQDAQGVCRHEGMAVFVPGLLPGERALVRIVKPEKRYAFGRVEKLLEKSPSRAEPFCPIYKRCGGCVCQHMTYEASLAFKRQQVQDLLRRVGGLSIEVPPVWGMAHPFGYRNKGAYPVAQTDGAFLAAYAAVDAGAKTVRIRPKDGKGRLFIAELRVLGEGDAPSWVQQWQAPLEKADLLALAAHPDDEILFLGGTIPYYAGEMGKAVQVAYLVPTMPYRRLELLDGLWLCGVRNYPILGHFPDQFQLTLKGMYAQKGWSRESVYRFVTEVYRACRPDVVVTQDVNGEYGHGAHRAAADAAQAAVALAADASYQKKMAHSEPWQIKKLYIHLYEQNPVKMDWRKPLAAFEGRTAFDVACRAFACHVSQQKTDYHVEDFGPYDNSRFGLAFSAIGEDTRKDDFFEHVE